MRLATLPGPAANALVRAIFDAELLGVALLHGPDHVHVLANHKYERLVCGGADAHGRPLRDVVSRDILPDIFLSGLLAGGPATAREVACTHRDAQGTLTTRYTTLTFDAVEDESGSVLVLAQDATETVRARTRAELFSSLMAELLPSVDARAAVRSVVVRTASALNATSSSLFVLDDDGKKLRGAVGEWDWTRTSFETALADWPTVEAALSSGRALYLTALEARGAEAGWFEHHGTVGALCVPLRANERRVGVLFFDFAGGKLPSLANVDFAESVASHCAAAIVLDRHMSRVKEISTNVSPSDAVH